MNGQAVQAAVPGAGESEPTDSVDLAIHAMYDWDFTGALRTLDRHLAVNPSDALGYAARATTLLFSEYDRLQILQMDFFGSDDALTDKQRLKPDPAVRDQIMAAVAETRRLAGATLSSSPGDRRTLFALAMGLDTETYYSSVIEKRYVRGGHLSMESQSLTDRMLALDPPIYDAYLTRGAVEYIVANLNPFYRFLAGLVGLRGSMTQAVEHLQIVVAKGRYYRPFAKILLAVVEMRQGHLTEARSLLEQLRREFPANPLYTREIARIDAQIAGHGRAD